MEWMNNLTQFNLQFPLSHVRAPEKMSKRDFALFERSEFAKIPTDSRSAGVSEGPCDTGALSFDSFSLGKQRK